MEAFVYCWTDHLTNKLYVGSHKGSTGVIKSTETIEKTAKSNTGKKRSVETINNLTLAQNKRYKDPDQRKIQSAAASKGWITRRTKHDNE